MGAGSVGAAAQGTQDRVDAARAAVDDVAQRWFDAQAKSAEIDKELAVVEQGVADAEAEAAATRELATRRALEIYKGSGSSFTSVLGSQDALESARRVELIDRVNARSNAAIDELGRVTEDLDNRRADLEAARAEQADVLASLEAEKADLEKALTHAVEVNRAEIERRARAAAAAARTAQAASTTSASRGASGSDAANASDGSAPPSGNGDGAAGSAPAATPAPPPPAAGEHPRHNEPFLACTRARESGGNYAAVNPAGYYGAYQFSQLTWDAAASHAGRPELIGVLPSQASAYDQDDLAWALYQWQGNTPWGGRC